MNFISAFDELNKLYEVEEHKVLRNNRKLKESLRESLSEKEIKYIDFLGDNFSRMPKNPSTKATEELFKNVPDSVYAISVADIEGVLDQCDYKKQVTSMIDSMNAQGFKTIGDLANSLKEVKESLTESDEEILVDEEPIADDEVVVEEPIEDTETVDVNDYVLECSKCGALVIKAIKEVTEDEESGLANVGEECAYCEASDGFKILGTFAPYEEAVEEEAETEVIEDAEEDEVIEEGIFDKFKKNKGNKEPATIRGYVDGDPSFSQKIAKELQANFGGQIKSVKLSGGEDADIWVDTDGVGKKAEKYIVKKYPDNAFSFEEYYLVKDLEEGIFNRKKKSSKKAAGSANNDDVEREVNFKVYDQNGTLKFNRDFTELPGKMNADDQFKHAFKEMSVYNEYRNSTGKRDWSFERVSNPPSPAFDTKRGRTKFLSMDMHLEGLDEHNKELEELFDANIDLGLSLDGGQGNNVDVL